MESAQGEGSFRHGDRLLIGVSAPPAPPLAPLLNSYPAQGADGVLVPGGFGDRGVQGKILAARYARENDVPFLGICLGMQIAVVEYARSVLKLEDANSTEFDPDTANPCVVFMPEVLRVLLGFFDLLCRSILTPKIES